MDIKNNRSIEAAFDQWLKSKNLRLFNSYDAMDMHIKGAMLATWQDAIALVSKKLSLLLCDEHLQKCESPTGIFNTQYPDEEPCLICLQNQIKSQAAQEEEKTNAARVLCETACELLDGYAHQDAMVILDDLEQALK